MISPSPTIAHNIHRALMYRSMRPCDLADAADLPLSVVTGILRGTVIAGDQDLLSIANALMVPYSSLLSKKGFSLEVEGGYGKYLKQFKSEIAEEGVFK